MRDPAIATAWSVERDSSGAVREAYRTLVERLGGPPSFLILHSTVAYDLTEAVEQLRGLAPGCPVSGGTSSGGVMTEEGFHSRDGFALGLWGIADPHGGYGVGAVPVEDDPSACAAQAVREAAIAAGRDGEVPEMVLLTTPPGCEESVLEGIRNTLGSGVPIVGGSSADEAVEGHWMQFANGRAYSNAVVVTVLYPSTQTAYAFQSGYLPTGKSGRVTRASGRTVYEIDGRPAADVYKEWVRDSVSADFFEGNGDVGMTTLRPMGSVVGSIGGVPYYRLVHAHSVTHDRALNTFADLYEGEDITCMTGNPSSLASRAGRVAHTAVGDLRQPGSLRGAVVVCCAGYLSVVIKQIDRVAAELRSTLQGQPFICTFTFGEQGCFLGGENRHGNLMNSVLVFGGQ